MNEKLKKTHGLPRVADTFIVDTKKTSVRLPDFAAPAEQPEERENKVRVATAREYKDLSWGGRKQRGLWLGSPAWIKQQ